MFSAAARRSIWASWAKQVWTAPKPRMAPQGGLSVRTTTPSISTDGTMYGPAAKQVALAITALLDEA